MKYIFSFSSATRGRFYSSTEESFNNHNNILETLKQKYKQSIYQLITSSSILLNSRRDTLKSSPAPPQVPSATQAKVLGKELSSVDVNLSMASTKISQVQPLAKEVLKVAYDYEYDYKTRKISVVQGELLHLLQKTNEHWWKVIRPGNGNKPFFVPAQYVSPAEEEGANTGEKVSENNNSSLSSLKIGKSSSSSSSVSVVKSENNNSTQSIDEFFQGGAPARLKSSDYDFIQKASIKGGKLSRHEASRSSHRTQSKLNSSSVKISPSQAKLKLKNKWSASLEELSKQIVFPGLGSESVADLTAARGSSDSTYHAAINGDSPGSSIFDDTTKFQSIPPCLSFRNPSFRSRVQPSKKGFKTDEDDQNTGKQTFESPKMLSVKAMESPMLSSSGGTFGKNSKPPPLPNPVESPVRLLSENWAEYYNPDTSRYYYFNKLTKTTSWKPPRNSSNKKFDELSSSLSDASAHASSFERSLESIPDFDCSTNLSFETANNEPTSRTTFGQETITIGGSGTLRENVHSGSKNLSTESVSTNFDYNKSEDESNAAAVDNEATTNSNIPVPNGWDSCWDDASQQVCYVNKITGAREVFHNSGFDFPLSPPVSNLTEGEPSNLVEGSLTRESSSSLESPNKHPEHLTNKWFTSTDPQERVYFYEENSTNSSWFLPVTDGSGNQSIKTENPTVPTNESRVVPEQSKVGNLLEVEPVKKRHSMGEVVDRAQKAKSLFMPSDLQKLDLSGMNRLNSIPRYRKQVLREGQLWRTKITENGKKVRKGWGQVYAVLTESHLSLYKDIKAFQIRSKTELEIELEGATVDWTQVKSSRKNVFQVNTPSDLQMLFQVDDEELARNWFNDVKQVTEKDAGGSDISLRLWSSESPEVFLDSAVGEPKSSRLNRNRSTKFRITSTDEVEPPDISRVRAHLKKFFSRRPAKEALVNKGIYRDESVFGCSLKALCATDKRDVPKFVEECIVAIESKEENLKTDGIYRASGNLSQVQKIRLQVDQNNMACLIQEEDVHVLAGCLKLFFRELKGPLIPCDLFDKAMHASTAQRKDKVNEFRAIINALAKPNRCTLQALLNHLLKIADYSEFNRMQIPNLAIVFGPTLMWSGEESSLTMAVDLMKQNRVIEALLSDYKSIFQ